MQRLLPVLALYFAVGFALLVIFEGPALSITDAWFWVWLLAWPVPVILFALKWILTVIAVLIAAALAFAFLESRR